MSDLDAALHDLAERYWDASLRASPTMAILQGDHRFDDQVEDVSVAADERRRAEWAALREELAGIDGSALDRRGRVTAALLRAQLDSALAGIDLRLAELRSDQLTGFHAGLLMTASQIRPPTPDSARALVRRHRRFDTFLDQGAARLRAGLAAGRHPARINLDRSINQVERYLASALDDDPFVNLAAPPDWDGEADWRAELTDVVRQVVRPAFERYRRVLADELAPVARSDDRPGLCWLADGAEVYGFLVRYHTTVEDLPAEEIHRIGLDDLARLADEYAEIGSRLFGTGELQAIFSRLRTDPELRYATGAEIVADAGRYLAAATRAMGDWFGRLPVAPCELAEVPAHLADDVPAAYYFRPAPDGSRPGTYFVNTSHPEARHRYETAAVAYHEAIPGHHLQLAIASELDGLPSFQRLGSGHTAFVEGWGLYAERLADEMGLYGTDLERIGMLAADSWRSCRLVVDTGMHALGWSRRQAVDFMATHAPVGLAEIEVEIDRYIGMPGQALAYKVGQRQILRLREGARHRLGPRFDIRAFHDAALGSSSVSLPVLAQLVEEWVAATASPA